MGRRKERSPRTSDVERNTTDAPPARGRDIVVTLSLFAVVFTVLAVAGYANTSATWDEPVHVTAGYAALVHGDYRIDPSHPPLARMWAALPTLAMRPLRIEMGAIDREASTAWLASLYPFVHRVMYVENDADGILKWARLMVVLLGVLLGGFVYAWTREWLGTVPAVAALVLFVLEPNLMAHASVVTTDLSVTAFIFGTVYFLWRCCRRCSRLNLAGLAVCCGLTFATKFSALLLAPIVLALLAAAVIGRAITPRRAIALAVLLAASALTAIWASYGFRYLPSESLTWSFDFGATHFASQSPTLAAVTGWVDGHRLLPNAYTQGFLYTQASAQQMPSFLAGQHSVGGWWYYFPVAWLIKTPVAHIVLVAVAVVICVRHRRALDALSIAFVALPIAVYLGAAMWSGINLGLRHILPIYPFLLLGAATAVRALLLASRPLGTAALNVVLLAGTIEFAAAYPNTGAFFNWFVGGPANGFRYLVDSNLDWGRDLKPLKIWMDRNGISHVNLAYFGQADPAYYHLNCTHLPGAPGFATDAIARPTLPGYVAISPTILQGVYMAPRWRLFYKGFVDLEPVAVIGSSLRVYWIERWPEFDARGGEAMNLDVQRDLADGLLLGLRWPEQAIVHYRKYLEQRPGDSAALTNFGLALTTIGRTEEAVSAFRHAVEARPDDDAARLTLAKALFGVGDLPAAATHARAAVRLQPRSAEAHDLLGLVHAFRGQFVEAREAFQHALELDPGHIGARDHLRRLDSTP